MSIRRVAGGFGMLLLLGVLVISEGKHPPPPNTAHFVPSDADWALFLPSLESLETGVLPRARTLGVADALVTWVEAHVGISVGTPGGRDDSGVHPKGRSVVFGRGPVRVLVLPVLSGASMEALVGIRSDLWGGARSDVEPMSEGMEWVREGDCLFVGWGPEPALGEVLEKLSSAPSAPPLSADETGEALQGFVRLGSERVAALVDRWVGPLGAGAPFVGGMAKGWLRGLGRWTFTLDFTGRDVVLRSRAGAEGERALSHGPSAIEGAPGALLPSNTSAVIRVNVDPSSLLRDLQWVVKRLGSPTVHLPEWGVQHVNVVEDLLPAFRGDVSLAILGLRAGVPALAPLRAPTPEAALRTLDWMAMAGLTDPGRVQALLATAVEKSPLGGGACAWAWTDPWEERVPLVHITCTGGGSWVVGVLEGSLVLWGGDASHGASRDVAAGRLKSLESRVQGLNARKLLSSEPELAGVHLAFTRIARELAERGVPPYQLRVLGRLRGVGIRVLAGEGPVQLLGEVVQ